MIAMAYLITWRGTWEDKPPHAPSLARFYVPPIVGGDVLVTFIDRERRRCRVISVTPIDRSPDRRCSAIDDYAADVVLELKEVDRG